MHVSTGTLSHKLQHSRIYTLLKSDVTRRDHVVRCHIDPMNVGSRIVNFIVDFISDGTVFA